MTGLLNSWLDETILLPHQHLQPMKAETRAIWELLFTNISMFDDLRLVKAQIGGNCPDFRHKESEICLW